jgi:hypothetical protein
MAREKNLPIQDRKILPGNLKREKTEIKGMGPNPRQVAPWFT